MRARHEDFDPCILRCPTLTAYLTRVAAWPRNFRRFYVEQEDPHAYTGFRTVARIKINPDGTIACDNADYAPTEEEATAIKSEVAAANFHKSIAARNILVNDLVAQLGKDAKLFVFRLPENNRGEDVAFVQQRVYWENGRKADLPWSFWSDGKWRRQEPDGKLPLFGQDRIPGKLKFLVHEGAKGAAFVQQAVDENSEWLLNHPWCEELKERVHLGWSGGTDRIYDVDWGPIKQLPPHADVAFVADHDVPGEGAIPKISKLLMRKLGVVRFTDQFPVAFDQADDWPKKKEWWSGKRYVGPTFDDLLHSATWATEEVPMPPKTGPKKLVYKVRAEFAAEWVRVEELRGALINRKQTNRILTPEIFNQSMKPFSHVPDTANLLANVLSSHCAGAVYRPGGGRGVLHVPGKGGCINLYRPSDIQPLPGDVTPFLEFLTHLIPDANDRYQVERWCATLIACEQVRMTYALLLISEMHGTGKGTLCYILALLVAMWNTSFPTEQDIVEGKYNDWLWRKRLAVVHEVHGGHSWTAANKLKAVITEREVQVSQKYIPNFVDENWLHVAACSNSLKPLSLEDTDRRWLAPRVTEQLKPLQYWGGLRLWLNSGGLGMIKHWAMEFKDYVKEGEHAPMTTTKLGIIAETRQLMARFAFDTGRLVAALGADSPPRKIVLTVNDVHQFAQNKYEIRERDREFQKPLVIKKALLAAGLHELRRDNPEEPRFMVDGAMTFVVANFIPEAPVRNWKQIPKSFKKKTNDIWPIFPEDDESN